MCPRDHSFLYATIVREPLSRIASHLSMHKLSPRAALQSVVDAWDPAALEEAWGAESTQDVKQALAAGASVMEEPSSCSQLVDLCGPQWFNNPMTRELSRASDAYSAAPETLSADDLQRARNVLERFQLVATLHDIERMQQLFTHSLGWASTMPWKNARHHNFNRSDPVWRGLKAANALDAELYEYAQQLAERSMAALANGTLPRFNTTLFAPGTRGRRGATSLLVLPTSS